jgi:hypothetical protein
VHRDKPIDVGADLLDVRMEGDDLLMDLRVQPSGAAISPYVAFAALFQRDPDALRTSSIAKEGSLEKREKRRLALG